MGWRPLKPPKIGPKYKKNLLEIHKMINNQILGERLISHIIEYVVLTTILFLLWKYGRQQNLVVLLFIVATLIFGTIFVVILKKKRYINNLTELPNNKKYDDDNSNVDDDSN
jgi:ABC-type bacteriocin/lantibiotic exporter with double-glycine peptidase domain